YKAGMKLIAANGDVDIKALEKSIHVLARLRITETAQSITINASKEVLINGGGSYTRWNAAGIEDGTSGVWSAHAAGHSLSGPQSLAQVVQSWHGLPFDREAVFHDVAGNPVPAQEFQLTHMDGGAAAVQTSPDNGSTQTQQALGPDAYLVRWTGGKQS
ncbi:DUF2345 domain-containing protein, partial [Undibacterium curvum]